MRRTFVSVRAIPIYIVSAPMHQSNSTHEKYDDHQGSEGNVPEGALFGDNLNIEKVTLEVQTLGQMCFPPMQFNMMRKAPSIFLLNQNPSNSFILCP